MTLPHFEWPWPGRRPSFSAAAATSMIARIPETGHIDGELGEGFHPRKGNPGTLIFIGLCP